MKSTIKRVIQTIMGIVLVMIVILAAFFVIVTFTMKGNSTDVPKLFGYSMLTVQSGSMEPTFSEGDVIIVKEVEDLNELKVDDIITFHTVIDMHSVINTHRIVKIMDDNPKMTQFVTKGDANDEADLSVVGGGNIIGQYKFYIPMVGKVIDFLSTSMGFVLIIVLPLLLVFLYQAYNLINIIIEMKKQAVVDAVKKTSEDTGVSELEAAQAAAKAAIEEANKQKEAAEAAMKAAKEAQEAMKAAQEAQAAAAAIIEQAKNQGITINANAKKAEGTADEAKDTSAKESAERAEAEPVGDSSTNS